MHRQSLFPLCLVNVRILGGVNFWIARHLAFFFPAVIETEYMIDSCIQIFADDNDIVPIVIAYGVDVIHWAFFQHRDLPVIVSHRATGYHVRGNGVLTRQNHVVHSLPFEL